MQVSLGTLLLGISLVNTDFGISEISGSMGVCPFPYDDHGADLLRAYLSITKHLATKP